LLGKFVNKKSKMNKFRVSLRVIDRSRIGEIKPPRLSQKFICVATKRCLMPELQRRRRIMSTKMRYKDNVER